MFKRYVSAKLQGNSGQQQKAYRMLQSRKIAAMKIIRDNNMIFAKAMIKKSYGHQLRPAVVLFQDREIKSAYCICPVGTSGLSCHVLALLLFMKHFHETGEKILELTCTQQLQKWHRRTKKGSIPMIPLKDIKVKSAKIRTENKKIVISPADPSESYLKRDVSQIINELTEKLKKEKPIEDHIYSAVVDSPVGKKSSLGQHLIYKYNYCASCALTDHQYCKTELFDKTILGLPVITKNNTARQDSFKNNLVKSKNGQALSSTEPLSEEYINLSAEKTVTVYDSENLVHKEIWVDLDRQLSEELPIVTLDISFLEAPCPGGSNYVDTVQNTEAWQDARRHKVTASRLPALLGFYGKAKLDTYMGIIREGHIESDISKIRNIQRGRQFEAIAIAKMMQDSNATIKPCGFFIDPSNERYGASPDGLGPAAILLQVKTRAENSDGPLLGLKKYPQYFVQCQLQMKCTNAMFVILQSYHPETGSSHYFLIKRNHALISVIQDVVDAMICNSKILVWPHQELNEYRILGKKLIGVTPNFESLKTLRTIIKALCKDIPQVQFLDKFQENVLL
eukprot:gene8327-9220_t